jgi:hypothetical protein
MPTTPIVHRFVGWFVTFDDEGLSLRPRLGSSVLITWDDVKFVCPVPTVERCPEGWREKKNTLLRGDFCSTLQTHGLLVLYVVVKDRRPIIGRTSGWTRFWLRSRLRPMQDRDDRFMADESLVDLELDVTRLGVPWGQLLDLVSRHARFDLVVFGM